MDAESMPPGEDVSPETPTEEPAPPIPVTADPRIPTREDADPSTSRELGGPAPAVGPDS